MKRIAAVVLAAGQSRRMGRPKMTLPWGDTTVIGQVVSVLHAAKVGPIVVVTGAARAQVEACLRGLPAQAVHNPRFAEEEMVASLQAGLQALPLQVDAALVVLGDQPQIETGVVRAVAQAYDEPPEPPVLIVPSYKMRRGHPWLVGRELWQAILDLSPAETLRDFLNRHATRIHYLNLDTSSILADLDTIEEYNRQRPG